METVSCDINVEERGSSGEIPMKKPCQVESKTAEMVQFNGCIFITAIKLSSLKCLKLVWWDYAVRLHNARWNV